MLDSHKGPFALLPQALALCVFLAGSELASSQTVAHNSDASVTAELKGGGSTSNAAASDCADQSGWSWNLGGNTVSCPAVIDALDLANKPTLLRNTTQSTKTNRVLSLPQVNYDTVHDVKVRDAAADFSLPPSDWCTVELSEFTIGAFPANDNTTHNVTRDHTSRPCHNHSYAPQDVRAPLVPSHTIDEHRSGVILPGANKDDSFIDHFRLIDEGPIGGPKHRSLVWIERPPDPPR